MQMFLLYFIFRQCTYLERHLGIDPQAATRESWLVISGLWNSQHHLVGSSDQILNVQAQDENNGKNIDNKATMLNFLMLINLYIFKRLFIFSPLQCEEQLLFLMLFLVEAVEGLRIDVDESAWLYCDPPSHFESTTMQIL